MDLYLFSNNKKISFTKIFNQNYLKMSIFPSIFPLDLLRHSQAQSPRLIA